MKINNITAYCRRGIECHTDSFKQAKCNKPVQYFTKNKSESYFLTIPIQYIKKLFIITLIYLLFVFVYYSVISIFAK